MHRSAHLPSSVLDVWAYCGASQSTVNVFPDGCCDLIWHAPPGESPTWLLTELADTSYAVDCRPQHAMVGFRLRPGVQLDGQSLLDAMANFDAHDKPRLLSVISDLARIDLRVDEALGCIAQSSTVRQAQQTLGVLERSLERLVQSATGRSPIYWRQLARARKTVLAVFGAGALGDVALANGYTDQAHMGRDFQRWFGASPGNIRRRPADFWAITASGYSNASV